jgi:hypothetical protein
MMNRLGFRVRLTDIRRLESADKVQTTLRDKSQTQLELKQYRFTELHKSVLVLVNFAASLQSEQFREFWLPCESWSDHKTRHAIQN